MSTNATTTRQPAAPAKGGKKPADKAAAQRKTEQNFVFNRQNYMLMIAGLVLIVAGFGLMYGKEDIFSTTKVTIAPIVVMAGFVLEIFAIMKKPAS